MGGHSGGPSGQTQIHTQDGASRAEQTDGGQGGAGSSGGQGRWSFVARAGATGGREGASPPHSDYPAPSLKMSVKIDFIYEI